MADILLVDDDAELVQSLVRVLSQLIAPHTICAAGNAMKALELVAAGRPLVAIIDLCINEQVGIDSGFELLAQLRSTAPEMRVLVLTGHGSRVNGVRAMQLGAASFLEKPVDPEHLAALIQDAIIQAELRREFEKLTYEAGVASARELCGESIAIKKLRNDLAFAAATSQPVLLLGETGTGKSLCARLIHDQSARRTQKFVHYHPNFGGGDIVQSELFGHTKGAFTGAIESRRGLVLEADGGTLFLDELDAVPRDTQVLLLDLVQEQRVRPVGSDSYHRVNCRFITAMNKPLSQVLNEGVVRKDLHFRIAQNVINIPPLRERKEDIAPLAAAFLKTIRRREGLNVFDIESRLLIEMQEYSWPGNIRELQGVIENGAYRAHFSGRSTIQQHDVVLGERGVRRESPMDCHDRSAPATNKIAASFHEQVESFKRELVRQALDNCAGNQVQAALLLGVDRGTVRRLS